MNDTLATALTVVLNAEKIGRSSCVVHPVSKITTSIFEIMKNHHYIGDFKVVEDGKGGFIEVQLLGSVNNCGVVKPRFAVSKYEFDKFEKRFLPAKDFGLMILSTSQGIMTQMEAKEKGIGGRLLAYVY